MPPRIRVEILGDDTSLLRSFHRSSVGARGFERDIGRISRGALAGSGIFRGLGRSIAFASGGFLAFASAGQFIRTSIDAAKEAQVTQRQLGQQLRNNGKAFADYKTQIDQANLSLSGLSGFNKDELDRSLTTILRTVPNVSRALKDNALAADLARARHIGLAQAALVVAKTEAGNTTLLRRQGFQIAKNATVEEALAAVRAKVAGQARAGTTEQERFGAVLHDTEEIIGRGILPTLNRYLISGTKWLQQMNESGKLQKDVAAGAHDFESAIHDAGVIIHDVDRVTGSFKNTLELLLALKVAGFASRIVGSVGGMVGQFSRARLGAQALGGELAVGNASLAAQAGVASFAIATLGLKATGLDKDLRRAGGGIADFVAKIPVLNKTAGLTSPAPLRGVDKPGQISGVDVSKVIALARQVDEKTGDTLAEIAAVEKKFTSVSHSDARALVNIADLMIRRFRAAGGAAEEAGVKAAHGLALAQISTQSSAATDTTTATARAVKLTASQRNTFFDNALSRILLRGGLGDINRQIGALEKADRLIQQRLKVTKDVTRRLTLEDELLQNRSQIGSLRQRQAQVAAQAAADARQRIVDALTAKASARKARQFRELGFTGTGEDVVPGVRRLRKELGTVGDALKGTVLDTPKLEARLAAIRKVLSEGVVPRDIRARIQQMFATIQGELNKGLQRNLTKFSHVNSAALLKGLGLSPEQVRALRERITQIGPSGTVPGVRSPAFAGGNNQTVVHTTLTLDGQPFAKVVTKHQNRRRQPSRRN